uniref:Uncharacterized protein n=1 Tax=Parascaris equorum TaxID=6256 RepID=A0A914R6Y3_PAREQ
MSDSDRQSLQNLSPLARKQLESILRRNFT